MEENTLLNTKTVLTIIVVVCVVTGGNLWINKGGPELGYERYLGYDFTIDYRSDMYLEEIGLGGGSATESLGYVEGKLERESLEQFGVIWVNERNFPAAIEATPEGALEYVSAVLEMTGTEIVGRGEQLTGIKDGHRMVYQTFDIVESGNTVRAIVGAWYCDEAGKFLMLFTIHVPDLSQPEVISLELEPMWREYLDKLVCQ